MVPALRNSLKKLNINGETRGFRLTNGKRRDVVTAFMKSDVFKSILRSNYGIIGTPGKLMTAGHVYVLRHRRIPVLDEFIDIVQCIPPSAISQCTSAGDPLLQTA